MTPFLEGMTKACELERSSLGYRGAQLEAIRKQFADMHSTISDELKFIRSLIQEDDYAGQSKEVVSNWIVYSVQLLRKIMDNLQADDVVVVLELNSPERITLMKLLESPIAMSVPMSLPAPQADSKPKSTPKGTIISKPIKSISQVNATTTATNKGSQ